MAGRGRPRSPGGRPIHAVKPARSGSPTGSAGMANRPNTPSTVTPGCVRARPVRKAALAAVVRVEDSRASTRALRLTPPDASGRLCEMSKSATTYVRPGSNAPTGVPLTHRVTNSGGAGATVVGVGGP